MPSKFHDLVKNGEEYKLFLYLANGRQDLINAKKEDRVKYVYGHVMNTIGDKYPNFRRRLKEIIDYPESDDSPEKTKISLKKIMLRACLYHSLEECMQILNQKFLYKSAKASYMKKMKEEKNDKTESKEQEQKKIEEIMYAYVHAYMELYLNTFPLSKEKVTIRIDYSKLPIEIRELRNNEEHKESEKMMQNVTKSHEKMLEEGYPLIRSLVKQGGAGKRAIYDTFSERYKKGYIEKEMLEEILFNGLVERDFLIQNDININKIVLTYNDVEIGALIAWGVLEQDDVERYIDSKDVVLAYQNEEQEDKNILFLLVSDRDMLVHYIEGRVTLEDIKYREYDISEFLRDKRITVDQLIQLKEKLSYERETNKAKKILAMFPGKEEIVQIAKEGSLTVEEVIELDRIYLCDINYVIDWYNEKEEMTDEEKENLSKIFTSKKINKAIEENDFKTLLFFKQRIAGEKEAKEIEERIVEEKSISEKINLHRICLISTETLKAELKDIDTIEEFEQRNLTIEELIYLYNIEVENTENIALIVSDEKEQATILQSYNNEEISSDKLKELNESLKEMDDGIDFNLVKSTYAYGILDNTDKIIDLYILDIIDVNNVNMLYLGGHIKDEEIQNRCLKGDICKEKVGELYLKGLIGTLTLEKMAEEEILTRRETEKIKNSITAEKMLRMMNATVDDSAGEVEKIFSNVDYIAKRRTIEKEEDKDKNKKRKNQKIISPTIRDEYIRKMGFSKKINQREKEVLKDYELYYNPETGIIVAEALFKERKNQTRFACDDATYIFHIREMNRIINSRKSEIIKDMKDGDIEVRRAEHGYKYWATSLEKAVKELEGDKSSSYNIEEIEELSDCIISPEQKNDLDIIKKEIKEGLYNIDYDGR